MRKMKYHSSKTTVDGIVFDSKKEAARYLVLKDELERGIIEDLRLQPEYELIPRFLRPNGRWARPTIYKADFCYVRDGKIIVEDVKGYKPKEYMLKRKLFEWLYKMTITET